MKNSDAHANDEALLVIHEPKLAHHFTSKSIASRTAQNQESLHLQRTSPVNGSVAWMGKG
jgi:hypothetical protein